MKKLFPILLFAVFNFGTFKASSQAFQYDWTNAHGGNTIYSSYICGGSYSYGYNYCTQYNYPTFTLAKLAVDQTNNLYQVGSANRPFDINSGPGTKTITPWSYVSNGTTLYYENNYIAKHDVNNVLQWAGSIKSSTAGTGAATTVSIVSTSGSEVVVAGHFSGTVNFDIIGTNTQVKTATGSNDVFFAKYNSSNGQLIWVKTLGGTSNEQLFDLKLDSSNNILISGIAQSTNCDMDPGAGTSLINSTGGTKSFIAKYDSNGNFVWTLERTHTGNTKINVDSGNNVYELSVYNGTQDLNATAGITNFTSNGQHSFVSKYSSAGAYVWTKEIKRDVSSSSYSSPTDFVIKNDHLYFILNFSSNTIDVNPNPAVETLLVEGVGYSKSCIVEWDSNGNYVWNLFYNGNFNNSINNIDVNAQGEIIYLEDTYSGYDIDPSASVLTLVTGNSYWAKLNADHTLNSVSKLSKPSATTSDIIYDNLGKFYFAESSLQSTNANLNSADLSQNSFQNETVGETNFSVTRYTSATIPSFTQVSTICNGAALNALPTTSNNGITGTWSPVLNNTETTVYTFTPTAGLFATTATMTIAVNPKVTPTFTAVNAICSSATLSALPTTSNNGITGMWSPALNNTETTEYTFTPTVGLCATTATMTITVNPPTINTITISACDSYTWANNGVTYTASGTYTGITTNCVTEQLVLTINNSSTNTYSVTACETFTWAPPLGNGQTYTSIQTGVTNMSTNAVGCPHIETLNLTITPKPNSPEVGCYEMAIFNTSTCEWDVTGERPAQPTELACYESVGTFNITTCQWNIVGTQPAEPIQSNCWDNYVFSTENCSWSNVGIQPLAPTAIAAQTLNAGSTVASLQANGSNLQWYGVVIEGDALATNTVLENRTYYVSQTINGCESERTSVVVTLGTVLCYGAKILDLTVIGATNVKWYASNTATTPLEVTALLATKTYYYTQTIGIIQTSKTAVEVIVNPTSIAGSVSGAYRTVCYNSGKILTLSATRRGNVQWQSAPLVSGTFGTFMDIVGETGNSLNTGNLMATTYFRVVVRSGVCESKNTSPVKVNVRLQSVSGTISGGGVSVCSGTNRTVLTLSGQIGRIQWQSSTDNENFVSITPARTGVSFAATNLTTTTYYRVMVTNGSACTPTFSDSVAIVVKSTINSGTILGTSLISYNTAATLTLSDYEVGSLLKWRYSTLPTGTYFNGNPANSTGEVYTTSRLTRDYYYRVSVTKDGCTSTTAPFLVDVASRAKLEDGNLSSDETKFNVIAYPNPSSESFTIQTSSKGAINVKVYDMQGRLVENIELTQFGSKLAAGTYNVIVNQGANEKTLRVIKK